MKLHALIAAGSGLALAACASSGETVSDEEKLASALSGWQKTGNTEHCLSLREIESIDAITDDVLLVEARNGMYLNEVRGSCSNADGIGVRFEYATTLSSLCKGEIVRIVENTSGMTIGSCSLGSFSELTRG